MLRLVQLPLGSDAIEAVTAANPAEATFTALNMDPDSAAESFTFTGRTDVSFPVPYLTPASGTNTGLAFDLFPKGSPGDVSGIAPCWFDLCSTDIAADTNNFECLRIAKKAGGYAFIECAKGGTGTVRALALQPTTGNVIIAGTTDNGFKLEVNGTARVTGVFSLGTDSSAAGGFIFNAAAGNTRDIAFRSAGVNRWWFRVDGTAESGSDAGSDFQLTARTDAGGAIDSPISIVRAAGGTMTLSRPVSVSNSTASTSPTTGAFLVTGGAGVSGALYVGGTTLEVQSASTCLLRMKNVDTSMAVNQVYGSIEWEGSDASSNASGVRAKISALDTSATGATDVVFSNTTAASTTLNDRIRMVSTGSLLLGAQSALATNATAGFVYIPGGAGAPTGTPTSYTGLTALYVDQTNSKLYFFSGGAWRDAGP